MGLHSSLIFHSFYKICISNWSQTSCKFVLWIKYIPKFIKNLNNFLGTDFAKNICGDVFKCTFRSRNRILIIYYNLKQNVFFETFARISNYDIFDNWVAACSQGSNILSYPLGFISLHDLHSLWKLFLKKFDIFDESGWQ